VPAALVARGAGQAPAARTAGRVLSPCYTPFVRPAPLPTGGVKSWRSHRVYTDVARIISTIFNPFLTAIALLAILAHAVAATTYDFWFYCGFAGFFTTFGPMAYVFSLYQAGKIDDLDMSDREQRAGVFGAFVIFYLVGAIAMALLRVPSLLVAMMFGYGVSSALVLAITRSWKISTHALGISAPVVALLLLYGSEPLPLIALIPVVGWSRWYLRAHTVGQIVAGALLGAVTTAIFFHLFNIQPIAQP